MAENTNTALLTTLERMANHAESHRETTSHSYQALQRAYEEDRNAVDAVAKMIAERDALAAEVKALRVDAERLTWHEADMAKGDEGVGIEYDETSGKYRFPYLYNGAGGFGGGLCHSSHDTLRAAIDAARASAATGGQIGG